MVAAFYFTLPSQNVVQIIADDGTVTYEFLPSKTRAAQRAADISKADFGPRPHSELFPQRVASSKAKGPK